MWPESQVNVRVRWITREVVQAFCSAYGLEAQARQQRRASELAARWHGEVWLQPSPNTCVNKATTSCTTLPFFSGYCTNFPCWVNLIRRYM